MTAREATETFATPMFPLGTVLLPGGILPLRVFEPRYRVLMHDIRVGDAPPDFGVVLIQRGQEVGGGDVRVSYGTIAHIVQAEEQPDGQWFVRTEGTDRIRVHEWLDEDPYPRAVVERWPDEPAGDDVPARIAEVVPKLRRVLALASEMGAQVPSIHVELDDDPVVASYQLVRMTPMGKLDALSLLAAESIRSRVDGVKMLVDEAAYMLALRLEGG
jgi:Lon protease-like protein